MKSYYQGWHAQNYNRQWHTFTEQTLVAVLSSLEKVVLPRQQDHQLRILDVGCGTGVLLRRLSARFPDAELYGVDASPDMLEQAQRLLKDVPHIHLKAIQVGLSEQGDLPFAADSFDLITCTNTFHYFSNPVAMIQGWRELLVHSGMIVLEDYVLRSSPFPWSAFEWMIRLYDPQHIRLYSLHDAQVFSQEAYLQVLQARRFPIDLFCQGWVLLLQRDS